MTGSTTPPPQEPSSHDALREAARSARARVRELIGTTLTALFDDPTAMLTGRPGAAVQSARADLRDAVAGHARLTRELGEPAEHVVLVVKAVAEEAIEELWITTGRHARIHLQELRVDLVRWAIESYYESRDESRDGSRDA